MKKIILSIITVLVIGCGSTQQISIYDTQNRQLINDINQSLTTKKVEIKLINGTVIVGTHPMLDGEYLKYVSETKQYKQVLLSQVKRISWSNDGEGIKRGLTSGFMIGGALSLFTSVVIYADSDEGEFLSARDFVLPIALTLTGSFVIMGLIVGAFSDTDCIEINN